MFNSVVHGMGRLLAYFYDLIPNYGVGIMLLTILVRLAMIPLAVKQAHIMEANRGNAEKMRKLLPEVKKIKEKYRDDKAKQYEEQKKLYDQHEVNMLGGLSGCLPMIVQMPVFLAMYSVLSGCNKVFGSGRSCVLGYHLPDGSALKTAILEGRASFLGMNLNLRPSAVLQTEGLVSALPYYVLVGVMGYTMWYQTRQMMKAQPVVDPQMAQTQKIMQFMPLLLIFASLSFPAGLTVYWSATNIWGIAQQYVLMRRVGPLARPKGEPVAASSPLKSLMSRFTRVAHVRSEGAADNAATSKEAGEPDKEKPAPQTPKRPAAAPPAKPAAKAAPKSPAKPGAKPTARPSASGGRRPAASRARNVPANKSAAKPAAKSAGSKSTGSKSTGSKSTGSKAGTATGGGPAGGGPGPGRPKGSGARKKRQGRS